MEYDSEQVMKQMLDDFCAQIYQLEQDALHNETMISCLEGEVLYWKSIAEAAENEIEEKKDVTMPIDERTKTKDSLD